MNIKFMDVKFQITNKSQIQNHGGVAMRKTILFVLLLSVIVSLIGCGETVSGVGKDVSRMGKGVNTFFFRQ